MIRVTVWNEYRHERRDERVRKIYPEGIHSVLASSLTAQGMNVHTALLDEPEHGLSEGLLQQTDVLIWWGHLAHDEVKDEVSERVAARVLEGMGLIALHSAHFSKPFKRLMGTSCDLKWREGEDHERLWVVDPSHAIVEGISERIDLEGEEMYGEFFDVPPPEELVFLSWFSGGEVFRSGCCYTRGSGRIFYFRPGHETYPTYHHPEIQRIIANAVRWATPRHGPTRTFGWHAPIEPSGNTGK